MSGARPCPRIVLFDGVCAFCDGSVSWLLARDRGERLCFAPLQGETAAALRARHPQIPADLDTAVYVDASGSAERVFLRSEAVFRVWAEIAPESRLRRWLARLPRPFTDAAYAVFVRLRYPLFGRRETCRLPLPEDRGRVLA